MVSIPNAGMNTRMYRTLAVVFLLAGLPALSRAQAARVGRLALLAPPAAGATCSTIPASAALQHSGMARILNVDEPARPRLLSLGVTAAGKARFLTVMMSTRDGRRGEGESVTVFFGDNGAIVRGDRSAYTTGTPARRSEDRRLGLLPADSARAQAMARALLRICRA
jgi:hypothetical protein